MGKREGFEIFLKNTLQDISLESLSKEYRIPVDEVKRAWHHAGYSYKIQIKRWRSIKKTTKQHLGLPDNVIARLLEMSEDEFKIIDEITSNIQMDRQGIGKINKSEKWKPRPHKLRRKQ